MHEAEFKNDALADKAAFYERKLSDTNLPDSAFYAAAHVHPNAADIIFCLIDGVGDRKVRLDVHKYNNVSNVSNESKGKGKGKRKMKGKSKSKGKSESESESESKTSVDVTPYEVSLSTVATADLKS